MCFPTYIPDTLCDRRLGSALFCGAWRMPPRKRVTVLLLEVKRNDDPLSATFVCLTECNLSGQVQDGPVGGILPSIPPRKAMLVCALF